MVKDPTIAARMRRYRAKKRQQGYVRLPMEFDDMRRELAANSLRIGTYETHQLILRTFQSKAPRRGRSETVLPGPEFHAAVARAMSKHEGLS